MKKIILASQSPRRKELLHKLGIEFVQYPAYICEDFLPGEEPENAVGRIAREKALSVAKAINEGLIIAADTIVVCEGKLLGKPRDENDAFAMLSMLSGKSHQVITAVCLLDAVSRYEQLENEITDVYFRNISVNEIKDYIKTAEPMDKAGAYGIQGLGSVFVEKIDGCYFNVVGLPLGRLYQMLKKQGVYLLGV